MAHFAQLDENNIVTTVIVVANSDCLDSDDNESEAVGIAFCKSLLGSDTNWKQTSYNTLGGSHRGGGTQLRKNYAGIGYKYDASKDAFYRLKPYASWTLNDTTCLWESPLDLPDYSDGKTYIWN